VGMSWTLETGPQLDHRQTSLFIGTLVPIACAVPARRGA
jgi:hypothetical protein